MTRYLTGITALNLDMPGRCALDWHSYGLVNRRAWCWAGDMLDSTNYLLGDQELYDATQMLRLFAPDVPQGTWPPLSA